MQIRKENIEEFAPLVIKLLQGVIYNEETKTWNELYKHQSKLNEYFAKIGIEFHFDEKEGYSFISQPDYSEVDANISLPRLTSRIPLSYEVTLLLVILREMLDEFDIKATTKKCFKTHREIRERVQMFFKDKANKSKLIKNIDTHIKTSCSLGFLKLNSEDKTNIENNQYEIKRIIKAKITLEDLERIKIKIAGNDNNTIGD
jgi:hypothetical protein